jgi:leucyl aminopeptidase (aminopeptidase T)
MTSPIKGLTQHNLQKGMLMNSEIITIARRALLECLGLKRNETLAVVCDPPCQEVGEAFYSAATGICREAVMIKILPRLQNGNEPPAPVGEWFAAFDVAVMPTSRSLTHTQARRSACAKGARIATLPGITAEVFLRTMKTDWEKMGRATRKVAADLTAASSVQIKTEKGTDLSFKIGGRHAKPDDGRISVRGTYGNLPAGEAYLAPFEGTAEGTLVVDGSFPLAGLLSEPLVFTIHKGKVAKVSGHPCCKELEKIFQKYHEPSRNIAEFGVGTLDTAIITGNVLEDEKAIGTIHIAVGDNSSMGGTVKVPVHLDGIVRNPSVWLDGRPWMEHGVMIADAGREIRKKRITLKRK